MRAWFYALFRAPMPHLLEEAPIAASFVPFLFPLAIPTLRAFTRPLARDPGISDRLRLASWRLEYPDAGLTCGPNADIFQMSSHLWCLVPRAHEDWSRSGSSPPANQEWLRTGGASLTRPLRPSSASHTSRTGRVLNFLRCSVSFLSVIFGYDEHRLFDLGYRLLRLFCDSVGTWQRNVSPSFAMPRHTVSH